MQPHTNSTFSLPEPDAGSADHSQRVAEYIRERIAQAGGSIPFSEFMQHALYAPGLGYYVSGNRKFGERGDFVTAPEISAMFGGVIARQVAQVLGETGGGQILEIGAGSGALAVSMLTRLADLDALPDRYLILEVSPELVERQRNLLEDALPGASGRIEWLDGLPRQFDGVIVANEVADALPVERFTTVNGTTKQLRVAVESAEFCWQAHDMPSNLAEAVRRIERQIGSSLPDSFQSEVCLALSPWIHDLVVCLGKGLLLLIDYGVTRKEYYAPDRSDGWLRCHFRHHVHGDPLILPGIQDLTAWVDFSLMADAALDAGGTIAGFVSQAHFLMNGGLQDELAGFESLDAEQQVDLSRQVKLLTLPGEMGEHVKCLAVSCGDIAPLSAFREFDRTHTL